MEVGDGGDGGASDGGGPDIDGGVVVGVVGWWHAESASEMCVEVE